MAFFRASEFCCTARRLGLYMRESLEAKPKNRILTKIYIYMEPI